MTQTPTSLTTLPASAPPAVWPLVHESRLPRIHVLSDVHLESGGYVLPADLEFDILVAAGDVGPLETSLPWLAGLGKPVVYVLGNHEYDGRQFTEAVQTARTLAQGTQVHVLERSGVVLQGVRFLGATLWTDFGGFAPELVMCAWRQMSDYRRIKADAWFEDPANQRWFAQCMRKLGLALPSERESRPFHPAIAWQAHRRTVSWLKQELAKRVHLPTVVVTHHAPCLQSLRAADVDENYLLEQNYNRAYWGRRYRSDDLVRVAAYASPLEGLLAQHVDQLLLWAHGHLHHAHDSIVEGVRVVCNPRGRYSPPLTAENAAGFRLFGYQVSDEAIARSQAAHALDPWRGDGQAFNSRLVVDPIEGFAGPLGHVVAPLKQELEELLASTRANLPFLFRGRPRHREAMLRWFEADCTAFRAVLAKLNTQAAKPLDPWFDSGALRQLQAPAAEPHPPWPSPFPDAPALGPADYEAVATRMQAWIDWTDSLAHSAERTLLTWGRMAQRGLQVLSTHGVRAKVARPPVRALRTLDPGRQLRFVVADSLLEDDAARASLDGVLDQELNEGRIPRQWPANLWPASCAPKGRQLLTLADLNRLLGPAPERPAMAPPETPQVVDSELNF